MGLNKINSKDINQNGYNKNSTTPDKIGAIFIYPVDYTPDDCLPCDGYILNKEDYPKLFNIVGSKFNTGEESSKQFRIPDFNITGRFLQPGVNVGNKLQAGLPNITGGVAIGYGHNGSIYSGAFYKGTNGCNTQSAAETGTSLISLFSASRSNDIYGKSSTVQPSSQIVHICIKYK